MKNLVLLGLKLNLVQLHRMRNTESELYVKYRLWMIKMCQLRLINCTKCTTLMGMLVWGGWRVYAVSLNVWGQGVGIWEISTFCCEPKTAVKRKL